MDPPHVHPGAVSPARVVYIDTIREIGITSKPISAAFALLFLGVACVVLYRFARALRVPGSGLVLRIISLANGWASLSQFQIVLWTLLIGTGAVYVVTLTGSLLVITSGTLILLGIAGAAAVGSQIKTNRVAQDSDTLAPGPVANLGLEGNSSPDGGLISWSPVAGASVKYTVQHSTDGGNSWITEATTLGQPRFRLVGLASGKAYLVRVVATNAMGPGAPATLSFTTRQPAAGTPAGAPAQVENFGAAAAAEARQVRLSWGAAGTTNYRLQFRPHESDRDWQFSGTSVAKRTATVPDLQPDTDYDFRVFASNESGDGPPSAILRLRTGVREPRWSDLVTDNNGLAEVDVTRVQMLLFTVISAFFVLLKIVESGTIPQIPDSYVALMGISNGVYLTAKFVGR